MLNPSRPHCSSPTASTSSTLTSGEVTTNVERGSITKLALCRHSPPHSHRVAAKSAGKLHKIADALPLNLWTQYQPFSYDRLQECPNDALCIRTACIHAESRMHVSTSIEFKQCRQGPNDDLQAIGLSPGISEKKTQSALALRDTAFVVILRAISRLQSQHNDPGTSIAGHVSSSPCHINAPRVPRSFIPTG